MCVASPRSVSVDLRSMIKWILTSRLSIKNYLSLRSPVLWSRARVRSDVEGFVPQWRHGWKVDNWVAYPHCCLGRGLVVL